MLYFDQVSSSSLHDEKNLGSVRVRGTPNQWGVGFKSVVRSSVVQHFLRIQYQFFFILALFRKEHLFEHYLWAIIQS